VLRDLLNRLKPGGARSSHLLLAAILWTSVGMLLCIRGTLWLKGDDALLFFLPAFILGTLKSFCILDRSAKKGIERITRLDDGSCLGAVYSIRTWLLVIVMMSFGYLLRHSSMSLAAIGVVYVMIGWALVFSSRLAWRDWFRTIK